MRTLRKIGDPFDQGVVVDRLDQMSVEAGSGRFFAVIVLPPARQSDEADSGSPLKSPNLAGDFVAVETGEADVEDDDLRPELRGFGEGRQAIVSGRHDVA